MQDSLADSAINGVRANSLSQKTASGDDAVACVGQAGNHVVGGHRESVANV
jgi:hypothetical protein